MTAFWTGKKLSEEHKRKISEGKKGKPGKKHTEEAKRKISEAWKGRPGRKQTQESKDRISKSSKGHFVSELTRKKIANSLSGMLSLHWKGGVTPKNKKIRNSIDFRLWREAVFARDNWTCQATGVRGGKLHPHHLQNFSQYPELRFAIDNGITLSEEIHREFHKIYGQQNNTREQMEEYLNSKNCIHDKE